MTEATLNLSAFSRIQLSYFTLAQKVKSAQKFFLKQLNIQAHGPLIQGHRGQNLLLISCYIEVHFMSQTRASLNQKSGHFYIIRGHGKR